MDLTRARTISSLDPISACRELVTLRIGWNREIVRLPQLPESLNSLRVANCPKLIDMSPVRGLPKLHTLFVSQTPVDMAGIVGSSVHKLELHGTGTSQFDWLADLSHLRHLSLAPPAHKLTDEIVLGPDGSCGFLAQAPQLELLQVWPANRVVSLEGLGDRLRALHLFRAAKLEDASGVAGCGHLNTLMIDGASKLADFAFLRELSMLSDVDLEDTSHFEDLSFLESAPLWRLSISRTAVSDLAPLQAQFMLRELHLAGCPVRNFEPLLGLRGRMRVTIDQKQARSISSKLRRHHRFSIGADVSESARSHAYAP